MTGVVKCTMCSEDAVLRCGECGAPACGVRHHVAGVGARRHCGALQPTTGASTALARAKKGTRDEGGARGNGDDGGDDAGGDDAAAAATAVDAAVAGVVGAPPALGKNRDSKEISDAAAAEYDINEAIYRKSTPVVDRELWKHGVRRYETIAGVDLQKYAMFGGRPPAAAAAPPQEEAGLPLAAAASSSSSAAAAAATADEDAKPVRARRQAPLPSEVPAPVVEQRRSERQTWTDKNREADLVAIRNNTELTEAQKAERTRETLAFFKSIDKGATPSTCVQNVMEGRTAPLDRGEIEALINDLLRDAQLLQFGAQPPLPESKKAGRASRSTTGKYIVKAAGAWSRAAKRVVAYAVDPAAEAAAIAAASAASAAGAMDVDGGRRFEPPLLVGAGDMLAGVLRDIARPLVYAPLLTAEADAEAAAGASLFMYGPGGVGKTTVAEALAYTLGVPFLSEPASQILSSWKNQSAQRFEQLVAHARLAGWVDQAMYRIGLGNRSVVRGASMLFIDEADVLLGAVDKQTPDADTTIVPQFKQMMQMRAQPGEPTLIVCAATNFPDRITDAALLRRFAVKLYVGLPRANERVELITAAVARFYDNRGGDVYVAALLADMRLPAYRQLLVDYSAGYTHAEIELMMRGVLMADIFSGGGGDDGGFEIDPATAVARPSGAGNAYTLDELLGRAIDRNQRIVIQTPVIAVRSIVLAFHTASYTKRNTRLKVLNKFKAYAESFGDTDGAARVQDDIDVFGAKPVDDPDFTAAEAAVATRAAAAAAAAVAAVPPPKPKREKREKRARRG